MKKIKNPLNKRIIRELFGDWRKNGIIFAFLTLTISFVSGMFIANESMLRSAKNGIELYNREDGHFELEKEAASDFIMGLETGEKSNLKEYFLKKGKDELDKKFTKEFDQEFIPEFEQGFREKFEARFKAEMEKELKNRGVPDTQIPSLVTELFLSKKETSEYQNLYQTTYDEAFDKEYRKSYDKAYNEAYQKMKEKVEEEYEKALDYQNGNKEDFNPVKTRIFENFYKNEKEDSDGDGVFEGKVRIYTLSDEINLPCIMKGRKPEKADEIAIDRMHSEHIGLQVGDRLNVSGKDFLIVGLLSYVNYYTLHEKSTDFVYDSISFNVGAVTKEGFDSLTGTTHYSYGWKYLKKPVHKEEEDRISGWFLEALYTRSITEENEIQDYLPAYRNPAINFAIDDMGADEAMGGVLLNILIVIISFIFAVTISNNIVQEASTIGTLRASGYRKMEILKHFLSVPVIVTLFSALVGNILSYTVFKKIVVAMYYNSYSLPVYQTYWNHDAFVRTTVVPVIIMLVVNYAVLYKKLSLSPLEFLRHEFKKSKRDKTVRLPKWKFFSRFRIRIIIQNIPNYIVLFIGIVFIAVMLAMAVGMNDSLRYYQENAQNMLYCDYQYILKSYKDKDGNIIDPKNEKAEAFSFKMMERHSKKKVEEVSVFGIRNNSKYIDIDDLSSLQENEAYISSAYFEKYNVKKGDEIELKEKFKNNNVVFHVAGIYDKGSEIAVFISDSDFHAIFDTEEESFNGFFSNSELVELQEDNIYTIITKDDILKMSMQLDHSMGAYMRYFEYLCVLLSAGLIYLITKILIEKNQIHISMVKILGYKNLEIARLYLFSTSMTVVLIDALSVWIGVNYLNHVWRKIMSRFSGWFSFRVEYSGYLKMFSFILIGYLTVMFFDYQRIKKIPMDEALKTVE